MSKFDNRKEILFILILLMSIPFLNAQNRSQVMRAHNAGQGLNRSGKLEDALNQELEALRLAVNAQYTEHSQDAETISRAIKNIVDRIRKRADQRVAFSDSLRTIAEGARITSDSLAKVAVEQRNRADTLRYLSTAQALAAKSLQINNDTLKGLLAIQAYHFHTSYGGEAYDDMIYRGLHGAMKQLQPTNYQKFGTEHRGSVRSLAFTSDGKMYSTGGGGDVLVWKQNNEGEYEKAEELSGSTSPKKAMVISGDENWGLIALNEKPYLQYVKLNDTKPKLNNVSNVNSSVEAILAIPNESSFLIKTSKSDILYLNPVNSSKPEVYIPFGKNVNDWAILNGNNQLFIADKQGGIYIIDREGKVVNQLNSSGKYTFSHLAVSKNEKWLAAGTQKGTVWLWNLQENRLILENGIGKHQAEISDLAFSPNGNLLASVSTNKEIQLWHLENGPVEKRLPITLLQEGRFTFTACFDAEGKSLLVGGDRDFNVWPTDYKHMADEMCGKLNRNLTIVEWERYVGPISDFIYKSPCNR